MNKKLKILLISSISPFSSANLGLDVINSLNERGHEVDFITKYKDDKFTNKMYAVIDDYVPIPYRKKLQNKFPFLKGIHRPSFINNIYKYSIVAKDESNPPVDASLILDKVEKSYDFILVLFWQNLLTTKSLLDIYSNLKVPILLLTVDMFSLTGGCNYFWDCRNFLNNCGMCPALRSKNKSDLTSKNFTIKSNNYNKIDCSYLGNTWMNSFASQSPLFKDKLIEKTILVVNEKVYKPRNKEILINKFNINPQKKFIIFAGAASIKNVRKGYNYLVQSMSLFNKYLSKEQKQNVLLLLAGVPQLDLQNSFDIEVKQLGVLDYQTLAEAYAVSDVFLSTSIEDAGPSMINQALMCGTPVIAFNIGVAIDLVISKRTGYCAKHEDLDDLVKGIKFIYNLNDIEKKTMTIECRNLALSTFSYSVFADNIEKCFLNSINNKLRLNSSQKL